jgi:2-polyprenyl-6-methoxyphenol hydroxylase-like FAD-dependent oxidoreductase
MVDHPPGMPASFSSSSYQVTDTHLQDDGTSAESWHNKVSHEKVLKYTSGIKGWPEVMDRLINITPADKLVDWQLVWRDPQRQWHSPGGHVVQVGDSAHTFLPSSGNGGTQAIEDAISLATCLQVAGKDNIPLAVKVHNKLR